MENLFEDMKTSAEGRQGTERLEQMIFAALPFESKGIPGWQVWIAFLGYAIRREKLVQEHQKRYDLLRQIICQELADLQAAKLIRADLV